MRRLVRFAALTSAAALGIACGRDKSPTRTASTGPDLRLANTPNRAVKLNPDELTESSKQLTPLPRLVSPTHRGPLSAPSMAPATLGRGSGNSAGIEGNLAGLENGRLPGIATTARAMGAAQTVAVGLKVVPIGLPSVPGADLNYDRAGFHMSPGGPRVVIRGGGVGEDHCDPNPRGGVFGGIFGRIFGNGEGMGSGRTIP